MGGREGGGKDAGELGAGHELALHTVDERNPPSKDRFWILMSRKRHVG